ncbi:gluconate kinase, FGGY family [Gracilibacillus ureilyticus]|uniref:Gluconate kinase, FGGY family n=1 Tax=Gracilibacillus ureilyticus TaxID=531814 RepID=A0A1H9PIH6_9BACI|nr:gluconokinase [Gracilibacillus ureilyticus]SER47880.1 gluconate kinase, FGGY family [Gracilibacillus ureilyticus]
MKELVIGLDLGTTSVKAVAFDLKGNVIQESEKLIETIYPQESVVEQEPAIIERYTREVLKDIFMKTKNEKVLTIGISCAMHSLICVGEDGEPLSNMLIWSDGRSSELVKKMDADLKRNIYTRTGTPIHPMSPFMKLIWMKENNYEPYRKAAYFMSMKEYLIYKWYGKRLVDYSMASATGLMNIKSLSWDKEVLQQAGVKELQLSTIVPPTEVLDGLNTEIESVLNWPKEAKLVIGAADGQLANLGNGAIKPGEVAVSVGTSGAIRQLIEGQHVNDNGETFSYAFTAGTSIIGGPTNNGGIALQWLKDMMEFKGTHEEFLSGAENIAIGAEGLLFIPYVNGERAPVWNQKARGNFYGLNVTHRRPHLVRAVLEGIVYNLYQIGQSLEAIAGKPTSISVNGGLSKSPLWVQIMADVFGKEIQLADTHHGAAWGAGWTALVAIDKVASFEQIKENIPIDQVVQPNMSNHEKYKEIFMRYQQLAKDIEKFF